MDEILANGKKKWRSGFVSGLGLGFGVGSICVINWVFIVCGGRVAQNFTRVGSSRPKSDLFRGALFMHEK